jgi:hypothetical protein
MGPKQPCDGTTVKTVEVDNDDDQGKTGSISDRTFVPWLQGRTDDIGGKRWSRGRQHTVFGHPGCLRSGPDPQ